MSKTTKKQVPVESTIRDAQTRNAVSDAIFNSAEPPLIKAVGYCQLPGKNTYVSYIIWLKGSEIVKVEIEEPNLRGIAEESAKLNFVNIFLTMD